MNSFCNHSPAPDWLLGLWQRNSIQFPDGSKDDTTMVHWGQTRCLYIDLRIPKGRPQANGRKSFDAFSLAELQAIAEQKGFAGHVEITGNICAWVRYIDYRPDTGRSDAGRLRVDGDVLYEEGDPTSVLATAYQEIYRRKLSAAGLCSALRLVSHTALTGIVPEATGSVMILIADQFMFARPRQQPLPKAETLRELVVAAGKDRSLIHSYLDCEVSRGMRAAGADAWLITESTLPFREGERLFERGSARLIDDERCVIQENERGSFCWELVEPPASSSDLIKWFSL